MRQSLLFPPRESPNLGGHRDSERHRAPKVKQAVIREPELELWYAQS